MKFAGIVQDGKLRVFGRREMDEYIGTLDGKRVMVEIGEHGGRSLQQNALWWVYVGILSKELGFTKEEMHDICKMKFLKRERLNEKTGGLFEYLASTATLSKEDFMILINQLQLWSAETLDIVLPDPLEQLKVI